MKSQDARKELSHLATTAEVLVEYEAPALADLLKEDIDLTADAFYQMASEIDFSLEYPVLWTSSQINDMRLALADILFATSVLLKDVDESEFDGDF